MANKRIFNQFILKHPPKVCIKCLKEFEPKGRCQKRCNECREELEKEK